MQSIKFTKMVASGNDFVVVGQLAGWPVSRLKQLAQQLCNRKYGAGADGLLLLEKSRVADVKMRVFNADGSEAEMCGNGARCTALYSGRKSVDIETKAGVIKSEVQGNKVRIKLTDPRNLKLDIPLKIGTRRIKVNFIDTGVPHTVIFVNSLKKIDVASLGRIIRYHKQFGPRGTNVNFVEILSKDYIKIRTYERGVEDETLACGTGAVASAIITSVKVSKCQSVKEKVNIETQGEEILSVYFDKSGNKFKNVWLEGMAKIVYTGVYDV